MTESRFYVPLNTTAAYQQLVHIN